MKEKYFPNEENKELLVMENIDKTAMPEVAKMLSTINLGHKYK